MRRRLIESIRAELRLADAVRWLGELPRDDEVVIVGGSKDAASELIRGIAKQRGAVFGVHRLTLATFAAELARARLAELGLAGITRLSFEALCTRVVDRLRADGGLQRLEPVIGKPGLPRALARTLEELRLAGVTSVASDPDLSAALQALDAELALHRLADRGQQYSIAAEVARSEMSHPLLGLHVLFLDVGLRSKADVDLVGAITARAPTVLATVPHGDDRSRDAFAQLLAVDVERLEVVPDTSLARVQARVFRGAAEVAELDDSVAIISAPGESRECVEIARRIQQEAARGVPFDRIAVLLRRSEQYRIHLEEAFTRARIPAHFAQGTRLPDPSGRAFLALLACAAENLSARRFAEYLSLGEVPNATDTNEPPPPIPASERWVPPDDELVTRAIAENDPAADHEATTEDGLEVQIAVDRAVADGSLRAPWRWERLVHEAAVIGGRDRWARRLAGLAAQLSKPDPEEARESRTRMRQDLGHLTSFALPLLDDLAAFPRDAAWTWRTWIDRLGALATRTLRDPERVIRVLHELNPMGEVGPVTLDDVRRTLTERLTDLNEKPTGARYGKVLVTTTDAARGLAFDVVFVPGLAEKMFPQKLVEDPLLLDAARVSLALGLATEHDRVMEERLGLHLALGAASRRVVVSYPRIDLEKGRPRVPSFYGLEMLQAAEGTLPSFEDLARRADVTGAPRIGWPAPAEAATAIDEAEHDLAVLDPLVHAHPPPKGAARYLLDANPHLARALRMRARRWAKLKFWKPSDGLVIESPAAKAALAAHLPHARSFSPTALEQLAACPYRFALRTILTLQPREVPEPIESLSALERGSLIHETQYELLGELRAAGKLPVRAHNLDHARAVLDEVLARIDASYRDKLAPAIERVWRDGIDAIRADLREWLRGMADDVEWTPRRFELAFGLKAHTDGRDPASRDEPLTLDIGHGLQLRGSIDLVEEGPGGSLRATDHKTGKAKVDSTAVIKGGTSLQPILYALALEKFFPGAHVTGGRLHYCTTRGDFTVVTVALDVGAREAARVLEETLALHFREAFFPAAPNKDECKYCDYRTVCGPYEELRVKRKPPERLVQLTKLRNHP